MTELLKEDIDFLDLLIDEVCKPNVFNVTAKYLLENKVLNKTQINDFPRLVGILKESGKVEVIDILFGNPLSIRKNEKTLHFQKIGGFKNEFKKQNLKTWYNEPWVGYLIAFITLLFAVYQGFQNHSLEKDIFSSKLNIDSLRNEVLSHKKKLDSLNVQYLLLKSQFSDLKNNTEKKK